MAAWGGVPLHRYAEKKEGGGRDDSQSIMRGDKGNILDAGGEGEKKDTNKNWGKERGRTSRWHKIIKTENF